MRSYDDKPLVAGSILKNPDGKYQAIISIAGNNLWLSEEADTAEEVDLYSRKRFINESTIQLKRYELIELRGGENHD